MKQPQLRQYAERVLGPCEVVADRSWSHAGSSVVEVRDSDRVVWFVKRHHERDRYLRETRAYRRWVPTLGSRAPVLRAYDDELSALVLSAVPGESDWERGLTPETQHQAGALLRRLHDSEILPPAIDLAGERLAELDRLSAHADGLLDGRQLGVVRARLRNLSGAAPRARVPCHGDYTPRNWLVSGDRLYLIDFEWTRPDIWVNDLARLYLGPWRERPYLGEAFLDGYGRTVGPEDPALLLACGALTTVFHIIWAHRHGETAFERSSRHNLDVVLANEY